MTRPVGARRPSRAPAPARDAAACSSALVLGAFVLVEAVLLGLGAAGHARARAPSCTGTSSRSSTTSWSTAPRSWNDVTGFGTLLGATSTVIALTAVGCLLLAWRGHGPRLPVFLAVAVAGETALFVLAVAGRRPPAAGHPAPGRRPADLELPVRAHRGDHRALVRARPRPGAHASGAPAAGAQLGPRRRAARVRAVQPALPRDALADRRRGVRRLHPALAAAAPRGPAAARPRRIRRRDRSGGDVDQHLADGAVLRPPGAPRRSPRAGRRAAAGRPPGRPGSRRRARRRSRPRPRAPWPAPARCRRARTASGRSAAICDRTGTRHLGAAVVGVHRDRAVQADDLRRRSPRSTAASPRRSRRRPSGAILRTSATTSCCR